MNALAIAMQVVIAFGVVNVWLVRRDRPTPWRPDGAGSLTEEFRRYGLPAWSVPVVGTAKLVASAMLVAGIWLPALAFWGAAAMAVLMAGAVGAHAKIGDPPRKALPSAGLLILSLAVAWLNRL